MKTIFLVVGLSLTLGMLVAAFVPTQYVREDETISQVLWNEKGAYVFSGVRRDGWSGTYLRLAVDIVGEFFGRVPTFGTARAWVVITKIDIRGVHQRIEEPGVFFQPQPFASELYRGFDPPLKWNGARFEPISDEEKARFRTRVTPDKPDYSNIEGWSSQYNLLNRLDRRVEVTFDVGVPVVLVGEREGRGSRIQRITAQLNGGAPVEILRIDEAPRFVRKDEFAELMAQR